MRSYFGLVFLVSVFVTNAWFILIHPITFFFCEYLSRADGLVPVLCVDKEMFREALIKIFLEFIGLEKVLDKTVSLAFIKNYILKTRKVV